MKDNKRLTIIIIFLCIISVVIIFFANKYNEYLEKYKIRTKLMTIVQNYESDKIYYNYNETSLEQYKNEIFDEKEIILSLADVKEEIYVYNIKKIAIYGLELYSEYITNNDVKYFEKAVKQADALLSFQNKQTGVFCYDYEIDIYPLSQKTKVSWGDSGTQGLVISFLSRIYSVSKDEKYKEACELALLPFTKNISEGGFVSALEGYPFYDGYSEEFPTYNLSDFLNSLIGLYDASNNLEDINAKELYKQGLTTLKNCIQYYDKNNRSLYNLSFLTDDSLEEVFVANNHFEHIYQIELIKQIEETDFFDEYLKRWKKGYKTEE